MGEVLVVKLVIVQSDDDVAVAKRLFREYADSLGFDLCFQDFERELARMPGDYGPPGGRLRLAVVHGVPAGCIAIRKLDGDICEMKRLYVRPTFRRRGIGKRLAEEGVRDARSLGYRVIRLDTIPAMAAATALYRSLGFVEIEPYCYNPLPGALYMELVLEQQ